jgi:hypothetical protein
VILSDANPGGQVDVHFRPIEAQPQPEPEPEAAEVAAPEETEAVPLVAAAVAETLELEPATEEGAAEAVAEEGEVTPFAAAAMDAVPEPEQEPLAAEAVPEDAEAAAASAAAVDSEPELEPVLVMTSAEASPASAADEATLDAGEASPLVAATEAPPELEPEFQPMAAEAEPVSTQPQVTERPVVPASLEVHPRIDRLVEITIHNHSPAGAENGALEARVASLEATLDAFSRLIASIARSQPGASVDVDVASRLEQLVQLQRTGVLSDEEFAAVKAQVLGGRVEPNGLNVSSERVLR